MRAQFVLSEIFIGLRRNLTMTIAVVVSAAVALGMLGVAVLMLFQTHNMKTYWYNKVEVTVFMCTKDDATLHPSTCAGGAATQNRMNALQSDLQSNALVQTVYTESQADAFARYQQNSEGSKSGTSMAQYVTPDQIPASLRVKLKNPSTENIDAMISSYQGQQGVETVSDQRTILQPLFKLFNGLTVSATTVAIVMVGLALMLIVNTVRLSAFSRRRETGIMRLVGASDMYIQAPFVLEGATAGLAGAALGGVGCVLFKVLLIDHGLKPLAGNLVRYIGWGTVVHTVPFILLLGVLLAGLTSLLTLQRYLRV
jgi:cell division transport system permease protein